MVETMVETNQADQSGPAPADVDGESCGKADCPRKATEAARRKETTGAV